MRKKIIIKSAFYFLYIYLYENILYYILLFFTKSRELKIISAKRILLKLTKIEAKNNKKQA
jgi:hypothetical protein